jgi:hypothetical protein
VFLDRRVTQIDDLIDQTIPLVLCFAVPYPSGAALTGSAAAQHSLRGAGGLEVLIEGIGAVAASDEGPAAATAAAAVAGGGAGWAGEASSLAWKEGESSWDDPAAAERLDLQLLALDVVRQAVRRNSQNVRHAVGGLYRSNTVDP